MTTLDGSAPPAPPSPTHREILTVFAGLMAGMFVAALDQTIVSTALPTIVGELGGLDRYSWVVTAYLLTATAVMPLMGKLSDLYGRKECFQASIVVFTLGSLLCGVAQDMDQLIAFRAVQGLGAGGLMVLVFAIVGDLVPPRERGRYQGLVASTFAVASVVGPLLGGLIVDHVAWNWVFLVNLPVGVVALVIVQRVLRLPRRRHEHRVDVVGAALLVAAVTCLLLVTVWGGNEHAWGSTRIVGLLAAGVALSAAFVAWESRVAEPVLPLRLFREPVFSTNIGVSVLLGTAMFGAIVFLPVYLQIVQGRTATASGLLMLPVMAGILTASVTSGRLITRLGRYRPFPIAGLALCTLGFALFSTMGRDTPYPLVAVYMAITGLGLGMVMPTIVLAVQNAAAPRDLGVATSSTTFFRQMGGAFGTAAFGAILTARVTDLLPGRIDPADLDGTDPQALLGSPESIRALPAGTREGLVDVFEAALHSVFRWAVPLALLAFALAWFIPERPLRETLATVDDGGDGAPSEPPEATG